MSKVLTAVVLGVVLATPAAMATMRASDLLRKPSGHELVPDRGKFQTTPHIGRTTDGLHTPKRYTSGASYDRAIGDRIKFYRKNWHDRKVRKEAEELRRHLNKQIDQMLDALEESARMHGY